MSSKSNLLNYSYEELVAYFTELGEPAFRALQVFRWIHLYGVSDFAQMTNIAANLRSKLQEIATILVPQVISEQTATDGVIKWLLQIDAANSIETVYIPEAKRSTLCVSSQAGCPLACTFCSTGAQGFNRNLSVAEIVGQLWWARHRLKSPITNIVFMGMGEPLTNYRNIVNAISIMLHDNAYNISKRRLTVSTSGIVPAILRLKVDCPVSLAISLHAPNDAIRSSIMPINDKYPLQQLLAACNSYLTSCPRGFITMEYVMLHGVNDSVEHAAELSALLKTVRCKINLIPFNHFSQSQYRSSSMQQIINFQQFLQKSGYITTIRKTRGSEVIAACGQLAGDIHNKMQIKSVRITAL